MTSSDLDGLGSEDDLTLSVFDSTLTDLLLTSGFNLLKLSNECRAEVGRPVVAGRRGMTHFDLPF